MTNKKTSKILMIAGFGVAAAGWAIIMLGDFSDTVRMVAYIGQSLGIGVGSIGIGVYLSSRRGGI